MPASDGYVELLTLEPRQWEGLARLLGETGMGHARQVPRSLDPRRGPSTRTCASGPRCIPANGFTGRGKPTVFP